MGGSFCKGRLEVLEALLEKEDGDGRPWGKGLDPNPWGVGFEKGCGFADWIVTPFSLHLFLRSNRPPPASCHFSFGVIFRVTPTSPLSPLLALPPLRPPPTLSETSAMGSDVVTNHPLQKKLAALEKGLVLPFAIRTTASPFPIVCKWCNSAHDAVMLSQPPPGKKNPNGSLEKIGLSRLAPSAFSSGPAVLRLCPGHYPSNPTSSLTAAHPDR